MEIFAEEKDGDVEQYLKSIASIPLLSPEEEKILTWRIWNIQGRIEELEKQIGTTKDPAILKELVREKDSAMEEYLPLRNKLWERNLRLVIKIAKKYLTVVDNKMCLSDLIQEGNTGLLEAVKKFDPRKSFKFSTYAFWWVRQSISRSIDDKAELIRTPVHIRERLSKISQAIKKEGKMSIGLLSEKTGFSERIVKNTLRAQRIKKVSSLDSVVDIDENGTTDLGDFVTNEEATLEDKAIESGLKEEIEKVLAGLSKKEAEVIRLRFGFEDGEEWTLQQVGNRYGISRERVRQIQDEALKKLRRHWKAEKIKEFLE